MVDDTPLMPPPFVTPALSPAQARCEGVMFALCYAAKRRRERERRRGGKIGASQAITPVYAQVRRAAAALRATPVVTFTVSFASENIPARSTYQKTVTRYCHLRVCAYKRLICRRYWHEHTENVATQSRYAAFLHARYARRRVDIDMLIYGASPRHNTFTPC